MAFAHPLVLNYAAGTKTLPLVNQDNFGSEYYLRESTQEFRAKIRHQKETLTAVGQVERHNVELTRTVYGTGGDPDVVQQVYLIYRHDKRDSATDAAELGAALTDLMVEARFADLSAWLS